MKQFSATRLAVKITLLSAPLLILFSFLLICSFTTNKMADDFLKQLGISKSGADEKITSSFLGGGLDIYGVKNAKNIALGNRKAVVLDLLDYSKKHVNSAAFIKQYMAMKESYKPKETVALTPEADKAENIARAKGFVADMEATVKKADANFKPIFEKSLADARKNLKEAEDPNNKQYIRYAKNYPGLVKTFKESYDHQIAQWEKKYPTNHLLYVKVRLLEFMDETKDIDFGAELIAKNGKKYFVNRAYESKGSRWKMAFRAGKEVIEPAREFVKKWIDEIKAPESQSASTTHNGGNG
ncbi:MAG TPA: hypothetical protein VEY10_07320 [Flavisolibacter sp.]|nr:hypothetical protein [Flavisolibacter sp.]